MVARHHLGLPGLLAPHWLHLRRVEAGDWLWAGHGHGDEAKAAGQVLDQLLRICLQIGLFHIHNEFILKIKWNK